MEIWFSNLTSFTINTGRFYTVGKKIFAQGSNIDGNMKLGMKIHILDA